MVFEKIADIIAEKLEIDAAEVSPESTFADLKADSLYIAEIMMDIEENFDISLDDIGDVQCVQDIVDYIEAQQK